MSYTDEPSAVIEQRWSRLQQRPNRRTRFAFVWIALAAIVVVATGMMAGGATVSADRGSVPFKGKMVNQTASNGGFPISTSTVVGEIKATHIGKGQVSGIATSDLSGLLVGECSELIEGSINFTAADGSVLNMVMLSSAICIEPSGEISFASEYDIVGGTKRFADADGTIAAVGTLDLASGVTTSTLSGRIAK